MGGRQNIEDEQETKRLKDMILQIQGSRLKSKEALGRQFVHLLKLDMKFFQKIFHTLPCGKRKV